MSDEHWHPFLVPVSELVRAQTDIDLEDAAGLLRVESLRVSMPMEIAERVDEAGRVRLAVAPPTQRVETSIMPVLHRLTVNLSVE